MASCTVVKHYWVSQFWGLLVSICLLNLNTQRRSRCLRTSGNFCAFPTLRRVWNAATSPKDLRNQCRQTSLAWPVTRHDTLQQGPTRCDWRRQTSRSPKLELGHKCTSVKEWTDLTTPDLLFTTQLRFRKLLQPPGKHLHHLLFRELKSHKHMMANVSRSGRERTILFAITITTTVITTYYYSYNRDSLLLQQQHQSQLLLQFKGWTQLIIMKCLLS